MTAEVALQDATVWGAVEQGPPFLELEHAIGRLLGVDLCHAPVVQHLAAAHGVAEVHPPVVFGPYVAEGSCNAPLGHDGVRLAEERFADEGSTCAHLARLDRSSEPGSPGPDDDYVEVVSFAVSHQKILGSEKAPEDTK